MTDLLCYREQGIQGYKGTAAGGFYKDQGTYCRLCSTTRNDRQVFLFAEESPFCWNMVVQGSPARVGPWIAQHGKSAIVNESNNGGEFYAWIGHCHGGSKRRAEGLTPVHEVVASLADTVKSGASSASKAVETLGDVQTFDGITGNYGAKTVKKVKKIFGLTKKPTPTTIAVCVSLLPPESNYIEFSDSASWGDIYRKISPKLWLK